MAQILGEKELANLMPLALKGNQIVLSNNNALRRWKHEKID